MMCKTDPCPFCGNDQTVYTTDKMQYRECNYCGERTGVYIKNIKVKRKGEQKNEQV